MALPLLTPSTTRELLERLEVRPKKNLGQNFLIEPNLVRKSLEMADIQPGDTVLEIGPGLGTLTRGLLNAGAHVYAVERDPVMIRHLENDLLPVSNNRLHLLEGDAIEKPRASLQNGQPFKVVANLPYAITTPWLESIIRDPLPSRMVLLVQKEAAQRVLANHGTKSFGPISLFVQSTYKTKGQHRVSPKCFYPAPEVDSILMSLELLSSPHCFPANQRIAIRNIFTRRRKQLKKLSAEFGLDDWFVNCVSKEMPETVRPEQVPTQIWKQIS